MKNILAIGIVALLGAGAFAACEKVETSTTYNVIPLVENLDKDTLESSVYADRIEAFLYFYTDTSQLRAGAFDQTVQGILYDKANDAAVNPDMRGRVNGDGSISLGPVDRELCVIMCCYTDPAYEIYAVRNGVTKENLPSVSVIPHFKLWEEKPQYTSLGWRVYYGKPFVPDTGDGDDDSGDDGGEGTGGGEPDGEA